MRFAKDGRSGSEKTIGVVRKRRFILFGSTVGKDDRSSLKRRSVWFGKDGRSCSEKTIGLVLGKNVLNTFLSLP